MRRDINGNLQKTHESPINMERGSVLNLQENSNYHSSSIKYLPFNLEKMDRINY